MDTEMSKSLNLNQTRELTQSNTINEESRTVEIAFMSETPVEREINGQIYNEILLTTPLNVDLSRLNNGAALLFNHDYDQHIGRVISARIDEDKVGRALVKFSSVGLGDEKWRMVQEGILTKVSCGYQISDYYFEGNNLYVTSVLITELSMVSVPADDHVGIGRSLNREVEINNMDVKSMDDEIKSEVEQEHIESVQDVPEEVANVQPEKTEAESDEVLELERKLDEAKRAFEKEIKVRELQNELNKVEAERADSERKAEIQSIAKVFNVDCTEALNSTVTVEEFKRNLNKPTDEKLNENNVKDNENMSISVVEALVRSLKGDKDALNDFEQGQRGYVLPNAMARANATSTVTAAGTVEQQYASDFIRPLLAETILAKMGIEVITGVTGREFTIPRFNGFENDGIFRPYGEGEAIGDTAAKFDSIVMKPRPFAGACNVTRSLLLSAPNAAEYVQSVLLERTRSGLESWIVDTAATEATQVKTAVAGEISESDILGVIEKLAKANVRIRDCYAIVSPSMYVKLRKTPFLSNTAGVALTDGFRKDQSYLMDEVPLMVSTFVADDAILVGQWSHIAVASWVGSTVDVDDTTFRTSLGVRFVNYHFMDVVVKHPEAFVQLTLSA